MVWYGMVWFGLVCYGMVWFGMVGNLGNNANLRFFGLGPSVWQFILFLKEFGNSASKLVTAIRRFS